MHKIYAFLLLLLAASVASAQTLPVIAYVTIQGRGNFKGQIECVGYSYGTQTPMDASTGMASGKRQHSPVLIVKRVDATSPLLLQAAYSNEVLKSVSIEFRSPVESKPFETVKLINATVVRINQFGGTASPEKLLPNGNVLEEIGFAFQKIEITNTEGKTSASDDWNVR